MKSTIKSVSALVLVLAFVSAVSAQEVNVAAASAGATIRGFWQQKTDAGWEDRGEMVPSNPWLQRGSIYGVIDGNIAGEGYFSNSPSDGAEKRYCLEITLAAPSKVSEITVCTLAAKGISDQVRHAKSLWISAMVDDEWKDVVGSEASPLPAEGTDFVKLNYKLTIPGVVKKVRIWLVGRNVAIEKLDNKVLGACPRVYEIIVNGEPTEKIRETKPAFVPNSDGSTTVNLDGLWMVRARHESDKEDKAATGSFGASVMPCDWTKEEAVFLGAGGLWTGPISEQRAVWFVRMFHLPASLKGRKFTLSVDGLNNAARVYINDGFVGQIEGPSATIDLTGSVQVGRYLFLSLLVYGGEKPYAFFGETPAGPPPAGAGLTGEVKIIAR